MNKIRIIDLLNKIANGEEVPKKIKYNSKTYFYDNEAQDYCDLDNGNNYGLFSDYLESYYGLNSCLNDEVEIIEEENKIPEKLNTLTFSDLIDMPKERLIDVIKEQRFKINSIIDYLKSKGNE